MILRKFLILRCLAERGLEGLRKLPLRDAACGGSSGQGSCLEGCTALIPAIVNFLTPETAGVQGIQRFPLARE